MILNDCSFRPFISVAGGSNVRVEGHHPEAQFVDSVRLRESPDEVEEVTETTMVDGSPDQRSPSSRWLPRFETFFTTRKQASTMLKNILTLL